MARRKKMDPERKAFINSLLEHYQPKDAQDVQEMLKDSLGETLQGMLEAEMDDHLGYSKYDYKNKETDDSRNGYSSKTVTSSMGPIDLDIPRDRKGEFDPQGFGDAIHAVFPKAEVQRCIVHQIRYSTKFISYKDLKAFMADLKLVYKADTEDLALAALDDLKEEWGKKYPASIASWRNNWPQLSTYFKYPSEIRKLIYTTNSIENFNRQLRKVTKAKTIFPTDDALFKSLYLAMMDATKKWTGKAWDWGLTLDQ